MVLLFYNRTLQNRVKGCNDLSEKVKEILRTRKHMVWYMYGEVAILGCKIRRSMYYASA